MSQPTQVIDVGGRPSDYNIDIASEICSRIADGQSVREIARDDDMPCMSTIFRWLAVHQEFSEQYARACDARAYYMAEEITDISDDGTNDWMERRDQAGEVIGWRENGEAIQRSKLRVDTRKWLLSKLQPKKYGDKVTQEMTGPDGGPIQTQNLTINIDASKLEPNQRELLRALLQDVVEEDQD